MSSRVDVVLVRPARNKPGYYEVVNPTSPDLTPFVSGTYATVYSYLTTAGVAAGLATAVLQRGGEIKGIAFGIRTAAQQDVADTPNPSVLAGVGSPV